MPSPAAGGLRLPAHRRALRAALAPAVLAAACSFDPAGSGSPPTQSGGLDSGSGSVADAGSPDGSVAPPPDSGGGTPDADSCRDLLPFAPSNVDSCELGAVRAALSLEDDGVYSLDTDTGTLTSPGGEQETLVGVVVDQDGGPDIFATATASFTLGPDSRLRVTGSRGLALVAVGDISIAGGGDGGIDVGAMADASGPGGDSDEGCAGSGRGDPGAAQVDGDFDPAGSGGGGGGFAAAGGIGAEVDAVPGAPATGGGSPVGTPRLVPLRGGCAGGAGGVSGGTAGGAGGALQLVAGGGIVVDGIVTARGGGGGNVTDIHAGGGGGGAGGGLLFEATTIDVNGAVTANGGGGGEGSRRFVPTASGDDGGDVVGQPAPGGGGTGSGGDGGNGGALDSEEGQGGLVGEPSGFDLAGGGGGGGSAGRIRLRSIARQTLIGPGAVVSPADG
ncbi:MAG TPA: hypothetical protein VKB80_02680 [Kofleriaceae bacterium]|nr:hypothetical protein [Kofleriaceae bacterium]